MSLPELRCLFNIFEPLPEPSQDFQLSWFWWRRKQRLKAITSRYQPYLVAPLLDRFMTSKGFPLPLSP